MLRPGHIGHIVKTQYFLEKDISLLPHKDPVNCLFILMNREGSAKLINLET